MTNKNVSRCPEAPDCLSPAQNHTDATFFADELYGKGVRRVCFAPLGIQEGFAPTIKSNATIDGLDLPYPASIYKGHMYVLIGKAAIA
jgi:hypothetical protein